MWPYILLILIIFFIQFEFNSERKERIRFAIGIILLFLFAALRGVSNGDYTAYLLRGKEIDSFYKIFNNNTHMEIGYSILYYFINLLHLPEQTIIMTMNLISIGCMSKFIKKYSANRCLSLLLFLPLYFQFDMQAARTAVAISICLMGITYVLDRKFLHFCAVIFLAMLFHRSAVIVLPIYFLMNFHINLVIGGIAIISSMCFVTFVGVDRTILSILQILKFDSFYVRYYGYISSEEFGYRFSLFDPRLLICILIYIVAKLACKRVSKLENLLINISLVNVLIMVLFSEHTIFCCRLSAFYNVYSIVLVPIVLKKVYVIQMNRSRNRAIRCNRELSLLINIFYAMYSMAYAYVCFIALGLDYKLFF